MTVGLDAFGCLDQAFDFIFTKAGFLEVAEQIHDLRLVMKVVGNFWVRGRGQTEQHVRVGRHYLGQFLDHLWPRRTLLATLDTAEVGGGNAYLGCKLKFTRRSLGAVVVIQSNQVLGFLNSSGKKRGEFSVFKGLQEPLSAQIQRI
jgi:hypothetical protein